MGQGNGVRLLYSGSPVYHQLRMINTTPLNSNCFGLGFIRSIDTEKGQFLIIAPCFIDFSLVNYLIKGTGNSPLEIPCSLLSDESPYFSEGKNQGLAASTLKIRHLNRKKLLE